MDVKSLAPDSGLLRCFGLYLRHVLTGANAYVHVPFTGRSLAVQVTNSVRGGWDMGSGNQSVSTLGLGGGGSPYTFNWTDQVGGGSQSATAIPATTTASGETTSTGGGLSGGAIAGIVVGAVVGVVALVVGGVYLARAAKGGRGSSTVRPAGA